METGHDTRDVVMQDADIIQLCIRGDSLGWKNLFEKYNTFIDRQIIRTFTMDFYSYGDDDYEQVKNDVIDTLLVVENLQKIKNPERFKQWLARICRNKTHDLVRKHKSIKSSAEESARQATLSLHMPLDSDSSSTLEDIVPSEDRSQDEAALEHAHRVKLILASLDWIYRIPMKLYLIFCDDLMSPEDIDRIAGERNVPAAEVMKQIDGMIDRMLRKHEKNICHEGALRVLSSYIARLKSRLFYAQQSTADDSGSVGKTEQLVRQKEQKLAELLAAQPKPIVPSNRQIGEILGLKEETVATRLFRARKLIQHAEKQKVPV